MLIKDYPKRVQVYLKGSSIKLAGCSRFVYDVLRLFEIGSRHQDKQKFLHTYLEQVGTL